MNKKDQKLLESVTEKSFSLLQSIEDTIQGMIKEKEENPDLIIPYSFIEFYNKPEMLELMSSVYEYCQCLASINSKAISLKEEGKNREAKKFIETYSVNLPDLGKNVAQRYGELLLKQRKLVSKLDDQNFFETIIYFIIKVIQPAFKKDQLVILDEELNRLFRSTAFNIVQRRRADEERFKKFPQLKKPYGRRDPDTVIKNIILRSWYGKDKHKVNVIDGIERPAYVKITPFKAITSRSPLISLLLPSPKDKIRAFEESRKKLAIKFRDINLKSH
jgi:Protein phosphatase 1 inhibitor